jgi:hypothetical protein
MSAAARRAADAAAAPYRLRWATGAEDLRRAQALRFEVFTITEWSALTAHRGPSAALLA